MATRLGLVLLLVASGGPAMAQAAAPLLHQLEYRVEAELACSAAIVPSLSCIRQELPANPAAMSRAGAPDHRYEGMAIGGGAGVAGGVLLGLAVCGPAEDPTGCVGAGLVVGAIGTFSGLLMGAQFPKEPEPAAGDSVPR